MTKKLWILVGFAVLVFGFVAFLRFSPAGSAFTWQISDGGKLLLPLLAISALIDSINPCAFSILLLTIAFLLSLGRIRSDVVKIGSAYIAGLFLVYLAIGLGLLQALHLFNTPHFMAKVGATLLIAWGALNLVNHFFPAFPVKLRIPHGAHRAMATLMNRASIPTALGLGGLVGLCEFPCTGGPYLLVLGLLHDSQTYFRGFGYLIIYNLIFILPLVLILAIASNSRFLEKVQAWQRSRSAAMRVWGGVAMVGLGALIFLL